ncbi:sulfurtransferase TusA family protein [Ammoniphilus sp. CFH 90114]|uniref:sulfurtransferase TusA family protein n=1 Tax=Ammoniphilus sp. CFH 90114 TaxID=2493665 RepID=UPI00100FD3C2|nr:OsmC family protein [Ammoniphilus sp. CFH 90114]RXT03583.1 osmotically inducible protein OsmC [Ammoniphilus sp. CFH 90114]
MEFPKPQATCDGGDLDCGSGLLLIIKKSMDPLEPGQVLEVRSRERTVAEDLPAWCRMVKHEFLGSQPHATDVSYFIRKGGTENHLEQDLEAARGYQWAVRVRSNTSTTAKVYSRNHTFMSGQPADFSVNVDAPSSVDYLLGALGSCLTTGFQMNASRRGLVVDAAELSLKGKLHNVLFHLQLEEDGNPSFSEINGSFYVSSPEEEEKLKEIWQLTLERSPIYQTLCSQVKIAINLSIIL